MTAPRLVHETRTRLRVDLADAAADPTLASRLGAIAGVQSVRINRRLRCVVIGHDGAPASREAAWAALAATPVVVVDPPASVDRRHGGTDAVDTPPASRAMPARLLALAAGARWVPPAMAFAVPLLPRDLRPAGAVAVIATRVAAQPARLGTEPAAVLLDAAGLVALAIGGHPGVVCASVLMREAAERSAARMLRQVDDLLDRLLPDTPARVAARRAGAARWSRCPTSALAPGDRVRLVAGDRVPVDGWVLTGRATVRPPAHGVDEPERAVAIGEHLPAGELVCTGALELHVEAGVDASRLARMAAHLRHAADTRLPTGTLARELQRLVALPLTGAALVLGLTGDTARSAAMLQADPVQGLDLALPVARDAARVALGRCGLLTSDLESIERLATARVLALQDTGVLCTGRWRIESITAGPGSDAATVRRWLAAFAGWPGELPGGACLSDRQVRRWVREGGFLRTDDGDLLLLDEARLGADRTDAPALAPTRAAHADPPAAAVRRRLAVPEAGRPVAQVVLASPLRADAVAHLDALAALGIERITLMPEADGTFDRDLLPGLEIVTADPAPRGAWLADAARDHGTVVLVHTVLRDALPPGGLGLCPIDADAGAHGVLLGDPLASLVAARRVARHVHARVHRQRGAATVVNAVLMTASALRWAAPLATAAAHHGFAALLLVDSLRIGRLATETLAPTDPLRSQPSS